MKNTVAERPAKAPVKVETPEPRRARFKWLKVGTIFRLLLMSVIVCFFAGLDRDRLSPSTWSVPLQYESDSLQILGWIKASSEFDYLPVVSKIGHRLGAPYTANWNDYAFYEEILIFFLGMFARVFGIMAASNLGMLISYLPSALAFYACCRMLGYQRIWSFVTAILFGFTFYNSRRHLHHLFLSFSYVVPLSIVACWLILASKRLRIGGRWFWYCIGTSFLLGLSNPYSLNMYLQLLCFSIALNFWRERDLTRLKIGGLCLLAAVAGFLSVNMDTLGYAFLHGSNPAATPRNYAQTEIAGYKPMEMIVPPANHNSEVLASIGDKYATVAPIKGELFSPYLGLIQLVAGGWMVAEFLWMLLSRSRYEKRIPAYTMQGVWILAYSVIGGLNNLFALAGLYLFRSANRYSIFISALCLFFLASRMSVLARNWKPATRWVLAAGLLAWGLFDQLPRPETRQQTLRVAQAVQNDVDFCASMEKSLAPHAMVFQLPVMRFPEGGPVHAATEYEMLRPFFFTKTLRFSFGSNQGRPREDWQFIVEKMPPAEMVAALEKYGFSAIYLNRKGFPDGGESLVKSLAGLSKTNVVEDAERGQICIALNPSPNPELPHTDDRALINYKSGWAVEERAPGQERHWSDGNATARFFNEHEGGTSFHVTGIIASLSPRRVTVEFDGRNVWSNEIGAGQGAPVDFWITAKSRYNTLKFLTDTPAVHPEQGGSLAVAFSAINLQVTKATK
jgi:phosphoglycerol transferase